jgi:hypothetical protein
VHRIVHPDGSVRSMPKKNPACAATVVLEMTAPQQPVGPLDAVAQFSATDGGMEETTGPARSK